MLYRNLRIRSVSPRSFCWVALFLISSWLLIAGSAEGDQFRLKSGERFEGTVIREIGDLVSIRLVDGSIRTVDKGEIEYHRKDATAFDKYLEKKRQLKDDDAEAHLALAKWCGENKLEPQRILHLKRVIQLDHDHEEARRLLGYEFIAGEWLIPGSEEAKRHLEKKSKLKRKPRLIPDDPVIPKIKVPKGSGGSTTGTVERPPEEPMAGRSGQLILKLKERVGKETPSPSATPFRLRELTQTLDTPLSITTVDRKQEVTQGLVCEIEITIYFLKTQMFYRKIPLYNVFKGEAKAIIYEIDEKGSKKSLLTTRIEVPFSASVQIDRQKGYEYTYSETVKDLVAHLSRKPFFVERGAKPIPRDE